MKCLWCHESFMEPISWRSVFSVTSESYLCETCSQQLNPIQTDICNKCGRSFKDDLCNDCIRWNEHIEWRDLLVKNRSLYQYNSFLKEVIAKWKYRGDAELVKIFAEPLRLLAKNEFSDSEVVVSIPISEKRLYERTFNQSTLLAQLLPYPFVDGLSRPFEQAKQSKKGRKQRLQLDDDRFQMKKEAIPNLMGKVVLLIDDIYTTGATIHLAAKQLREYGAKAVQAITVARG